ncbi:MAG: hypothetical protein J0L61_04435, partial [Planctomycetes bacterium]|nr:hypothetical protein [Planctomycetota bacterium]
MSTPTPNATPSPASKPGAGTLPPPSSAGAGTLPKPAAGSADEVVAKAVREISHIATLPEITVKIIELVEDPTSTAQDLHKVIAN